ncbi:MAG: hypothetical protein HYU66_17550 [Armatimonadetes bacterium]|nr:hypothetical protein [Armatimonadota bacterium]
MDRELRPEDVGQPHAPVPRRLHPLDLDGIVYSFHFYLPFSFTYQGVYPDKPPVVYPGVIEGEQWDKERLREAMRPVADFEEYCNVPIYIGEFSAARWAAEGSAYRWLKDVIEVFEEHGWDWSYHAYREWDGWSVEHATDKNDRQRAAAPTDQQQLLIG